MSKPNTTPFGEASFPKLFEPDTKFKASGEYNCKLMLDGDDAQSLMGYLDEKLQEAYEQMQEEKPKFKKVMKPRNPYTEELDEEGEETGRIGFNFKMAAVVEVKNGKYAGKTFTQKPVVYDAKGQIITKKINVGTGSIVKVAYETAPYFKADTKEVGITLRLKAVQIKELVEFGGKKDASAFGFGEEDGGFDADEMNDTPFGEEEGGFNSGEGNDSGEPDF
ncbi:ssDNA-binding protein [Nitrincola sp. A-D6]|uniref:ssDNA-binding protein n=1 Tax=Nitrincola sp. A-D6 TaxID=1545442 RepID=UPI00068BC29A|nr:ssDNA-binding protein [Nitrincola sp. A-D6]